MSMLSETAAGLRLFGDDLDPVEVTRLLGAEPTTSARKGDIDASRKHPIAARSGKWVQSVEREMPSDLDKQIGLLLAGLTDDLAIWRDLTRDFRADVFAGLFMVESNEGLCLSPRTLLLLGERGLELDLDIYAPTGQ